MFNLFFSSRGTINRSQFLVSSLIIGIVYLIVASIIGINTSQAAFSSFSNIYQGNFGMGFGGMANTIKTYSIISGLVNLFFGLIFLFLVSKRVHSMDKLAYPYIILYIFILLNIDFSYNNLSIQGILKPIGSLVYLWLVFSPRTPTYNSFDMIKNENGKQIDYKPFLFCVNNIFSFDGRIGRKYFLYAFISLNIIYLILISVIDYNRFSYVFNNLFGINFTTNSLYLLFLMYSDTFNVLGSHVFFNLLNSFDIAYLFLYLITLFSFYLGLSTISKRSHDTGTSFGLTMFIIFVSLIISIFTIYGILGIVAIFLYLLIKKGNTGPNIYGLSSKKEEELIQAKIINEENNPDLFRCIDTPVGDSLKEMFLSNSPIVNYNNIELIKVMNNLKLINNEVTYTSTKNKSEKNDNIETNENKENSETVDNIENPNNEIK